jgi:uncharacterized protein
MNIQSNNRNKMNIEPQIFTAQVMHKRHFPAVNTFTYNVYYLSLPIQHLDNTDLNQNLAINKLSYIAFHTKHHGQKDDTPLADWIRNILSQNGLSDIIQHIKLITMPCILGYVFNPVSFWVCLDNDKKPRAVLCQVNNTFGETHNYLCMHDDARVIMADDVLLADKIFHVSPFLQRSGFYKFRFAFSEYSAQNNGAGDKQNNNKIAIWIDYYDEHHKKQLSTSLIGRMVPLKKSTLRYMFFRYPLVTLKAIFLIHLQALKLITKGIKYIAKPKQKQDKISKTQPSFDKNNEI